VLAEIGDDRTRFADARALKAYAGSAPVTRPSGRSLSITHRHIKNNRLATAGWIWAFAAAANCEPAREHYRRRREHGDRHGAATRHLFNKLIGQLYSQGWVSAVDHRPLLLSMVDWLQYRAVRSTLYQL
jgi:transposase